MAKYAKKYIDILADLLDEHTTPILDLYHIWQRSCALDLVLVLDLDSCPTARPRPLLQREDV